jgi:hypothetical protein
LIEVEEAMKRFEYEGPVYVRPLGRGIVLERLQTQLEDEIDRLVPDAVRGWEGEMRIEIDVRPTAGST